MVQKTLLLVFSLLFFIVLVSLDGYSQTEEENVSSGELINRTVILLDFINAVGEEDYEYLSQSIPDSIRSALIQTEKFNLDTPREAVLDTAQDLGIPESNFFNSMDAVRIAEAMDADVVVIGKYQVLNEQLKVVTHALDLESNGRIAASSDVDGSLEGIHIFDVIDKAAEDLATKMVEALPPIPQRVIRDTRPFTFVLPENEFDENIESVKIKGDFTGWQPVEMKQQNGEWQTTLDIDILSKKEFEYMYIVNEEPETAFRKIQFDWDEDGTLYEVVDYFRPQIDVRPSGYFVFGNDDITKMISVDIPITVLISFKMNFPLPFIDIYDFGFEITTGWFNWNADKSSPLYGFDIEDYQIPFHHFPFMISLTYDFKFLNDLLYLTLKGGGGMFLHYVPIEYQGTNYTTETSISGFFSFGISFGYSFIDNAAVVLNVDYIRHILSQRPNLNYISVGPGLALKF